MNLYVLLLHVTVLYARSFVLPVVINFDPPVIILYTLYVQCIDLCNYRLFEDAAYHFLCL